MTADDERLARALKALRRKEGKLQREAAADAGVSRRTFARVEQQHAGELTLDTLRAVFAPFGATVRVSAWWKGAELDRLIDEHHAALVEHVVGVLARAGWETAPEVTYSEYGERGSIDVLGGHAATRSGLVVEVKSTFGSIEETNRRLDVKTRLAPKLVNARFGFWPHGVSRLLVLPEDRTLRRIVDRHSKTLAAVYPQRSREVRAWIQRPSGTLAGLWFLSEGRHRVSS